MPPPMRDVVALDEDAVAQVEPVVDSAAAADGVLIQHAQAGNGLARVDDASPWCR